jgi:hypothetical protein
MNQGRYQSLSNLEAWSSLASSGFDLKEVDGSGWRRGKHVQGDR